MNRSRPWKSFEFIWVNSHPYCYTIGPDNVVWIALPGKPPQTLEQIRERGNTVQEPEVWRKPEADRLQYHRDYNRNKRKK